MRPLQLSSPALLAALAAPAFGLTGSGSEPTTPVAEEATSSLAQIDFDKGLKAAIADGDIEVNFGGRVMYDFGFQDADRNLDANTAGSPPGSAIWEFRDGSEFRRARLYAKGTLYDTVDFKVNYDFAGGDADFKDVYMQVDARFAKVRAGHFYEPFGLEELTSSKYMTFNERGLTSALVPSRNGGLMLHDSLDGDVPFTWAAGIFRNTNDFGDDKVNNNGDGNEESGAYNGTARVTVAPVFNKDEGQVVHLGLAASLRTDDDGRTNRFRVAPENHFSPRLADTGSIASDGYNLYGAEAAWTQGPISLQGEYMMADVDQIGASTANFSAYYFLASFFLTGEHRPYKNGLFQRVKPKNNLGQGGSGAWELTARYSSVDLNDAGVQGGELTGITGGVNWYLNPNARVMLNYVHAELDNAPVAVVPAGKGELDAILLRFQFDF